MVFEYTVKYNGRRYLPGEDVPMDEPKTEEVKAETVAVTETVAVAEPPIETKALEEKDKPKGKKKLK